MAAAMGADEYGFGSVAMIATGCVMARICHTNNCPVGVASQVLKLGISFIMLLFLVLCDVMNIPLICLMSEGRIACQISWCAW